MPLLKDNRFVADTWASAAEGTEPAADADLVVELKDLVARFGALAARPGRLGVRIANNERPEVLAAFLDRLTLIVVPFPAFTDGRAFSLARQLREAGYRGEIRAVGNVLPDQLQFLLDVGFDSFEVPDRFPEGVWQRAAKAISLSYQVGSRTGLDVWRLRGEAGAWNEQPHAG